MCPAHRERDTLRRLHQRLTYGNVVASLALFIALGGTSYAAVALPRNSVGPLQLRPGSVGSQDVKDRSLEVRDLSVRARRTLRPTATGQVPAGTPGTQAPAASGAAAITVRSATGTIGVAPVDDSTTALASVSCAAGQQVTGGGVRLQDSDEMSVVDSFPDAAGTTWLAHVDNDDATASHTYTIYALCTP